MKRISEWLLLITITLAPFPIANAEEQTITISSGEWPPFISEHLKHYGVAARIISESLALQNINAQYGWFPWQRTYSNVKNGIWDASAIWAETAERNKDVLFSDPVIKNTTVLFFRKETLLDWKSYEDLSGLVIGATNGYFYGGEFEQAEKSGIIIVERTTIESNNFKKLAVKRLDAVIAEIDTGYEIMRQVLRAEQIESIIVSPKIAASFTNHLIISKKIKNAEQLISTFNKGLKELTESGQVHQYMMESRKGLYHQDDK
jgi:polar amino acid transport system substrate-binding protein